jgi:hypothetical protein
MVGGPSNVERTGTRDLTLSRALRKIPDVRHIDIDMLQYCPLCRKIEVVVEASADPRKASDLARRVGKQLTANTVLIIHRYNDDDQQYPVIVSTWTPTGLKVYDKREMSWDEYLQLMHDFHTYHLDEVHK